MQFKIIQIISTSLLSNQNVRLALKYLHVVPTTSSFNSAKSYELVALPLGCVLSLGVTLHANFIFATDSEFLASQRLIALGTGEAITMVELLVISYKFDTTLNQLLALGTPLRILITIAVLADIVTLNLGKRLAGQRIVAHCADEAIAVVCIAIMLH